MIPDMKVVTLLQSKPMQIFNDYCYHCSHPHSTDNTCTQQIYDTYANKDNPCKYSNTTTITKTYLRIRFHSAFNVNIRISEYVRPSRIATRVQVRNNVVVNTVIVTIIVIRLN